MKVEYGTRNTEHGMRRRSNPEKVVTAVVNFTWLANTMTARGYAKKRAQHFSAGLTIVSSHPDRWPQIPYSVFRILGSGLRLLASSLSPGPNVLGGIGIEFGYLTVFGCALHVVHVVADNLFGLGVINHHALCAG
jgi:hypothetical protein